VTSYNTGATASASTAASVAITIPSGVLAGDVMFMCLNVFTETGTAPSISFSGAGGSWTLVPVTAGANPEVANSGSIWNYGYTYYRVATSGDPGATLTITESGSSASTTWFAVAIASYTSASTTAPVDVAGGTETAAVVTTIACPSLNTVVNNDWGIYLGGGGVGTGSTWTGPATQRQSVVSVSAGIGAAISDSNGPVAAGSSIGGGNFTTSNGSTTNYLTAFTVGLAPPSVTGPPLGQQYMGNAPAVIVTGAGWRGASHSR